MLLLDTISIGFFYGWKPTSAQRVLLRAAHIGDHENRSTASFSKELEPEVIAVAEDVVNWLNSEIAPSDREFVLEDALYLIAKSD